MVSGLRITAFPGISLLRYREYLFATMSISILPKRILPFLFIPRDHTLREEAIIFGFYPQVRQLGLDKLKGGRKILQRWGEVTGS